MPDRVWYMIDIWQKCVPYFKNELNDIVTIKVWMDTHFSVYVYVCVSMLCMNVLAAIQIMVIGETPAHLSFVTFVPTSVCKHLHHIPLFSFYDALQSSDLIRWQVSVQIVQHSSCWQLNRCLNEWARLIIQHLSTAN